MSHASGQEHRGNRLLAALSPETFALMERDLKRIPLAQGAVIFEPGAPVEHIYFPQSGMISQLVVTRGGTVEISLIGREGALGLHRGFGPRRSFTRATAQVAGDFSVITAARFEEIVRENESVKNLIARHIEIACAEAQQMAACNAIHDAAPRLCRWLLQCADRVDGDVLPLTQDFLAQMVGVRRTTLTLLAQSLQKKGLISYSRGKIMIVDRAGLEAGACECYGVIHHQKLSVAIGAA